MMTFDLKYFADKVHFDTAKTVTSGGSIKFGKLGISYNEKIEVKKYLLMLKFIHNLGQSGARILEIPS